MDYFICLTKAMHLSDSQCCSSFIVVNNLSFLYLKEHFGTVFRVHFYSIKYSVFIGNRPAKAPAKTKTNISYLINLNCRIELNTQPEIVGNAYAGVLFFCFIYSHIKLYNCCKILVQQTKHNAHIISVEILTTWCSPCKVF